MWNPPPPEDPRSSALGPGTCLPWYPYQRCYLGSLVGIHHSGLGSANPCCTSRRRVAGLALPMPSLLHQPRSALEGQLKPLDALVGVPKVGIGARRGGQWPPQNPIPAIWSTVGTVPPYLAQTFGEQDSLALTNPPILLLTPPARLLFPPLSCLSHSKRYSLHTYALTSCFFAFALGTNLLAS